MVICEQNGESEYSRGMKLSKDNWDIGCFWRGIGYDIV